jgi:hypothetical protein
MFKTMDAWLSLTYVDGVFLSVWLGVMYYVKKRIDFHFEQKGR